MLFSANFHFHLLIFDIFKQKKSFFKKLCKYESLAIFVRFEIKINLNYKINFLFVIVKQAE